MPAAHVLTPFHSTRHDHARCVTDALARAERHCTAKGLRLTALRRRVLEIVLRRHAPIGAYEILEELGGGHAAPPTVYRALAFLIDAGFVHRLRTRNAFVGCGAPQPSHASQFLICRRCDAVAEITDAAIARALSRSALALGFHLDEPVIEMAGLCRACTAHG